MEALLGRHSRRSEAIHAAILSLLIVAGALLFIIRVDVVVKGSGIVRPMTERQDVHAPTSGVVARVALSRDAEVARGEEIVTLSDEFLDDRMKLVRDQLAEERNALGDLEILLDPAGPGPSPPLRTERYQQDFQHYRGEREQAARELAHAEAEETRIAALSGRGLVPRLDLANARLRLGAARSALQQLDVRYRTAWAEAAGDGRRRIRELLQQWEGIRQDSATLHVRAPVGGTLEEVANISPGSYVRAGDFLATISPVVELHADVLVEPDEIGLLRPGMPARLLIDAFNYNDWGFVRGRIRSISHDYVLVDDHPMFRADVLLEDRGVRLENGYLGRLRKGMTLQARFTVAKRSLWQLLRDDLDDWLNPARQPG